jgi:hypothetical protein
VVSIDFNIHEFGFLLSRWELLVAISLKIIGTAALNLEASFSVFACSYNTLSNLSLWDR